MKKEWGLLLAAAGLLLLLVPGLYFGCFSRQEQQGTMLSEAAEKEEIRYISQTAPEDCYLCGKNPSSPLSSRSGQMNVGIISLNTFEIVPIEINRYDTSGSLLEEPAAYVLITNSGTRENCFSTATTINYDRGYADVMVYLNRDYELNVEQAASFLCTDCLNDILEECWGDSSLGIGVINFHTNSIRLFNENITAFMDGDFYVSCDMKKPQETGEDFSWMDLLIFYCPERYR